MSGEEDNVETIEAAEALLNMESPNNILDEKRLSMCNFVFIVWICKHFNLSSTDT